MKWKLGEGLFTLVVLFLSATAVAGQGKFPLAANAPEGAPGIEVNVSDLGRVDGPAWGTNAPIPIKGGLSQTTLVADDNGFVYSLGGGLGMGPDTRINQLWRYDSGADTWMQLANIPGPGFAAYGAAVQLAGFIYVFGGIVGPPDPIAPTNAVFIYDIANDAWAPGANMPDVRFGAAVCQVNGRIFIAGGGTSAIENQLWEYDYVNDVWITTGLAPMPSGLTTYRIHGVGLNSTNTCYAFAGGFDGILNLAYNATTNVWSFRAPMPAGVTDPGVVTDGTLIYVTGGPLGPPARLQIYDPVANTWTRGSDLPSSVNNTSAALAGGFIYNVGGFDGTTSVPFNYSVAIGTGALQDR